MTRRKTPARSRKQLPLIYAGLLTAIVLFFSSCTPLPASPINEIGTRIETFVRQVIEDLRQQAGTSENQPGTPPTPTTQTDSKADSFSACPQFFAGGRSPVVTLGPTDRVLCYDAFAILHSGESKTAVFVAEKLNQASVADTDEKRTNRFYPEARLRSAERATLEDYKGSGYDRGHMAPAGDMPTAQAMAQSFSLANMVPQAPEHNRGVWAKSVEAATRKYAARASGDVYIITGPVFEPNIEQSPSIGAGRVRVPKYLFKLVYDQDKNRAWAHWQLNDDSTKASRPITYPELVKRTGIEFLPGLNPAE